MRAVKLSRSRRAVAWRNLAVYVVNTALERGLLTLDYAAADARSADITAAVEMIGRQFELTLSYCSFGEVKIDARAKGYERGRWPRAVVWLERRQGCWLQVPGFISRDSFADFTLSEQQELAAMTVEPAGYGFGPVV
ncbi:hypothetical protein [Paraburkholderia phenoliruptrix]|uniref:hypothetical protein n=1 Tax=Paraburkholderia phenoliruptrix TaxID=252970 RepID=UPI0034CFF767